MLRYYFIWISLFSTLKCIDGGLFNITQVKPGDYTDETVLYEISFMTQPKMRIPAECSRFGICDHISFTHNESMVELINIMMAGNVKFLKYDKVELQERNDLSVELCKSKLTTFQPQAVKDTNGMWYVVINSIHKIAQSFRGEACTGQLEEACSKVATFQNGYEGRCIQKYNKQRMIIFSQDFKYIITKMLPIPTCCACVAYVT